MPECHKCRWNDEPPTDEKAAACHKCHMAEDYINHKGKVFVSFNSVAEKCASRETQSIAVVEEALQRMKAEADGGEADILPECCQRAVLTMLDFMGGLTERELKVLVEVANGANLAEIADAGTLERRGGRRDRPMTRQCVSHIWRGIVAKFPTLATVLETGTAKSARAAVAARREERRKRLARESEERRADHATAKPKGD